MVISKWLPISVGASIAQCVKRWPAELVALSLSPSSGRHLLNPKWGSIAQSLSLSPTHRPDMTEILLTGCKIASHMNCLK